MKKITAFLLSCLLLVACMVPAMAETGEMKIKLFKVGKADCFIIRTENHTVMIDTAEDDDSEKILSYMDEKGITHLDYLILTTFSKNNIGSARKVLEHVTVGRILIPNYEKEGNTYSQFMAFLGTYSVAPIKVTSVYTFTLDSAEFTVTPAAKDFYAEDDDADYSLVTAVSHGSNSFLFAGDVKSERITEMLGAGLSAYTFLKVPDHGAWDEKSQQLLDAVQPKYAVITCSSKNPASDEMLSALQALGTTVYQTRNGSIALTSDGSSITFKQ